jgi:hypothetical protein
MPITVASTAAAFMEDSSMEDSIMVSMADVASEADFGGRAWRSGLVWVQSP